MDFWWGSLTRRVCRPLTPSSIRELLAGSVGAVIWVIWLTGMMGDTRQVTMLALSAVSILGSGLVIQLRRAFRAEQAMCESEQRVVSHF